jgi:hypothetical protein
VLSTGINYVFPESEPIMSTQDLRHPAVLGAEALEPPLWDQARELFRGRMRWLIALTIVFLVGLAIFAIVCAVSFFRAEGIREMIAWAEGFGLSVIILGLGRFWIWTELQKHTVLHEVRRLQLQIARLQGQLDRRE